MISDQRVRQLAEDLIRIPGVCAVTLGGSRARGTSHDGSDVDLGLYYDARDLDLDALGQVATTWSSIPAEVAAPGRWGPWVDGGAWLRIDETPVDLILRARGRVTEQCRRAVCGQYAFHAQPGHPLGFLDVSYAGEVATCRPLADPQGFVASCRELVTPYPAPLRDAFVADLWQADFLTASAWKSLPRSDIAYVELCCSTALLLCAHAWHAAAGGWATNEKGLVPGVASLPLDSHGFADQARACLAVHADDVPDPLVAMIDRTRDIVANTRAALANVP